MQRIFIYLFVVLVFWGCKDGTTSEEEKAILPSDPIRSNQTYTYHEGIAWWDSLAAYSEDLQLFEYGETDAGYPLHLAVLGAEIKSLSELRSLSKNILLINNAIHPGEPDGLDASMAFFRDRCSENEKVDLQNTVMVCIPFFNIGGALNRNYSSRANQNGPVEYGFRGNAQNLDLNRDFVKCDSRNTKTFAALLQLIEPDIYLETHVSNGADYQYTMTYLATQTDKLGFEMGALLHDSLIPYLESSMLKKNREMSPYVNVHGVALDSSFTAFYDSPRYSTGLTSLHNIYGFITETHMLKPFDQRVKATYDFIGSMLDMSNTLYKSIQETRSENKESVAASDTYVLDWSVDSSRYRTFPFKGYEYSYIPSEVEPAGITLEYTELANSRLYYDRSSPYTRPMTYYAYFKPEISRQKPMAYVIPRGYHEVTDLLAINGVDLDTLANDSIIQVVRYTISNFETMTQPYEKHYLHYSTSFKRDTVDRQFMKGDILISMGTDKDRFIVNVLEPDAPDSYFNWNFFDAVLQQKEWFSPYVIEDKAAEMLKNDPRLKAEFTEMWMNTPGFSDNKQWQLYWIYKRSDHYEKEHMTLPVFRIEN